MDVATYGFGIFMPTLIAAIAIVLVDRVGRVPLQIVGFAGMTVALCVLGVTELLHGGGEAHLPLVFVGFALFNLSMNAGPNATTYALPAEIFPSEIRASALLFCVAGCCMLALVITSALRIEPKGRTLGDLAGVELAEVAPHPVPP